MQLNSLRGRVVTWYVGLLAGVLILFGFTIYFGVQGFLKASLESSLEGRAKSIGLRFLDKEEQKGPAWLGRAINESYAPDLSGRFIRITRQDGVVLYFSGGSPDPSVDDTQVSRPSVKGATEGFRSEEKPGGTELLLFKYPFVTASRTSYLIETGAPLKQMRTVLATLLKILLIVSPLIVLAAALGGKSLMAHPLRPLVVLSEQAEHIGLSRLGERLPIPATGDEMERLALSLNRMIARLEDALNHNRRFSDEVSHELRTPLTIIRGELEHVLLRPEASLEIHESVGSALEEIHRISEIVESLLEIGQLDAGADSIDAQSANVSKLCRWVMEQMRPLAEEKEITISLQTPPLLVKIDAPRMKRMLVNLIDNAIKYTPRGGSVDVTSFPHGRFAVIEVSDTGIGIAAEALPHIFDRFFRTDEARTRTEGGTGLGLSIVKAICNAHNASIEVQSEIGKGTVFRVTLPLTTVLPSTHEEETNRSVTTHAVFGDQREEQVSRN